MSIASALSTAITGLGATGRSAQVVSSNISNALTEGYGRRDIELGTSLYGGVKVNGITRHGDPALLADRRFAQAETGGDGARAEALDRIAGLYGEPGSGASIAGRVAAFEASLVEAASRPDSAARLNAVAAAAGELAGALNRASDGIQAERQRADAAIDGDLRALRDGLARVDRLNDEIAAGQARKQDVNGLKDQRQQVIDAIAGIVPLRELPRQGGAVALITATGQVLLDNRPAEIEFDRSNAVTPGMTLGAPLSGLTINDRPIDMGRANGPMSGGTLAAHFEVRDGLGVAAQDQLDLVAADLATRFETPTLDPTSATGVFTDGVAAYDPATREGLSGRIALNPAVDGNAWRLRDGIGAAAPGDSGESRLLLAFSEVLAEPRGAASPALGPGQRSAGGLADALMSQAGTARFQAERTQTFSSTRADTLRQEELSQGVDTDQEMQKLLLIETAYGANTKVIQAADDMLQRLLEL